MPFSRKLLRQSKALETEIDTRGRNETCSFTSRDLVPARYIRANQLALACWLDDNVQWRMEAKIQKLVTNSMVVD
jgi:hypothetical protein